MAHEKRVQIWVSISQTAGDVITKYAPGKHAYGYMVDMAIKQYFTGNNP